ncbi:MULTISPECIES: endonuclease/exonuclease/phosphatase family protein [Vibrio]|nr:MULTISPECIES: endonuclease/exonuclease/phosphatase family protein [Vibrio]MBD1566922.1 endonuclease/exonuclease/phosphatase family protein [Vibrio sp. S12_S33]MDE1298153.1 endonuclease/exonuclease/phosphatase family protein [Vibrio aestuarianus]MDF9401541.1 endonuclease/exonuclease/phosphatase family protein [Vibrio sp. 1180_3]CAH8242111.1 Endo/exonuclease/phosphatase domain-containing protein [Vibrio aestuarianus]
MKFFIALSLLVFSFSTYSSDHLRLATYNSKFLSACMNKVRVINYQETVHKLNADIIALQEVRDRYAVERFFPSDQWNIIIDDESTDDLNLAFVIRKGLDFRLASGNILNADENIDFAFPKSNSHFIDERRVLTLYVTYKNKEILFLNHHAKSRYNGRSITDEQRTQAALDLIDYITTSSTPYIALLGDFNDTPDDRSLNTLEIGLLSTLHLENNKGSFLVNLTEPLIEQDAVSYGLKSNDVTDSIVKRINPSITGSRQKNLEDFDTDLAMDKALYDQILLSASLYDFLGGQLQAKAFDWPIGIQGNDDTRASDYIPIYVDFSCLDCEKPTLKIKSLLPNPAGSDTGKETVTIHNIGPDFQGTIILQDRSLAHEVMDINIKKDQILTHTISSGVTLNNTGDTIRILNRYEELIDEVTYTKSQEQTEIYF